MPFFCLASEKAFDPCMKIVFVTLYWDQFSAMGHIHVKLLTYTRMILIEPRHEKTNILVSDLVRHKPGCTATEDG